MRLDAPVVCPKCGTAGPIFVAAEGDIEEASDSDDPRDAWVRIGMMRASASRQGLRLP